MSGKTLRNRLFAHAIAIAGLWASFGPNRSHAQENPSVLEHLDVYVLVDVTTSMYLSDRQRLDLPRNNFQVVGTPEGNDPERFRWDAVRLLLDLLTADDRVMIVPFNETAPATLNYQKGQVGGPTIPGDVTYALQPPRAGTLTQAVESFAHRDIVRKDQPRNREWSQDTAIFHALQEVHRFSASDRKDSKRTPVIILLTDGGDTTIDDKERASLDNDSLLVRKIRGTFPPIPVQAIALGKTIEPKDYQLLERIAKQTGGGYVQIREASQLIPTFRNLIWTLNYCWIKTPDAGTRQSVEEMNGILDFGILSYRDTPIQTRLDRKSSPPPTINTEDFKTFLGELRRGNDGNDYLYEYFGPRAGAKPLKERGGDLTPRWDADPADERRTVSFSKRTDRPLFTLSEPSGREFDQFESVPIAATFDPVEPFEAGQFRLSWSLRPSETEFDRSALRPMDKDFRARAVLPRIGNRDKARYTLHVEAEGIREPQHPLSGYRLVLPEKVIEVRRALRLVPDPAVVNLTSDHRSAKVVVRGFRPLASEIKLNHKLELPRKRGGGPNDTAAISVQPRPAVTEKGEPVTEFELTLNSGEPGAEYQDGSLVVSADPSLGVTKSEPVRIPVHLQLRKARLKIDPEEGIFASFGSRTRLQPPMPLKVVMDGALGVDPAGKTAKITLKKNDAVEFTPDELWIERLGQQLAAGSRKQTLELPLGQEFAIRFSPKIERSREGTHRYELSAILTGKEASQADSAFAPVSVEYEFPRLEVTGLPDSIRVPRNGSRQIKAQVFLRAEPGFRQNLGFRVEKDYLTSLIETRLLTEMPSVLVGEEGSPLTFEISAPSDAQIKKYSIRGEIFSLDKKARSAPVKFDVEIDDLVIGEVVGKDRDGKEIVRPDVRTIPVELWMGSDETHVLQVKTALGKPLGGEILVSESIDRSKDPDDFLLPRPAICSFQTEKNGTNATSDQELVRTLTVRFPVMKSVAPNRVYRMFLDLEPDPALALPKKRVEFQVRYRRVDDLRPAAQP